MRRKFLHDISASSLQVIVSQVCGLAIFYVLSVYFSKNDFGEISWSLAVLLTAFSILSMGIDQVMVKKIAAGEDPRRMVSAYFFHVLVTGLGFYLLLLIAGLAFPRLLQRHHILLFLGVGKLMIFLASPCKQLANGLEKFRALLFMSVCSNLVRAAALIGIALLSRLNLTGVVLIFIAGDLSELLLSLFITRRSLKVPVSLKISRSFYRSLLKESLPQAGVVVFTSAIARFDWILLGILASNIALAEYSFAFRVFEVAMLPLLVVAPVLIPRFTRLFGGGPAENHPQKVKDLRVLFRIEIITASLVSLVLNILWVPVIDLLTQGKYGTVNRYTVLILSASMPFLYANNFLWTLHFSKGRLRMIFAIFFLTFLVNIAGNLFLIPLFGGRGAALAYLIATGCQFICFGAKTPLAGLPEYAVIGLCPVMAFFSGYLGVHVFSGAWLQLILSLFLFLSALAVTRLIRSRDLPVLRRITGL